MPAASRVIEFYEYLVDNPAAAGPVLQQPPEQPIVPEAEDEREDWVGGRRPLPDQEASEAHDVAVGRAEPLSIATGRAYLSNQSPRGSKGSVGRGSAW